MMATDRIVHVVDDDPAVCRSLGWLLYSADLEYITYESARAFLEAAPEISSGCVLLDIELPDMNGLELQDQLDRIDFSLPMIVITGHTDTSTAVRAMKGGAVDFIEKPFDDERLIAAIESALSASGPGPADQELAQAAERIAALSPRERQVLDGLVAGQQSKTIAYDLGISVRTVEVHRARMLERLGTHRLAEAIRLAVLADLAPNSRRIPNARSRAATQPKDRIRRVHAGQ